MQNYLILYNPYYESNVIGKHLEILKSQGQVAFGKVRSKLRTNNADSKQTSHLDDYICPLQLFLTDYENLFVTQVSRVCANLENPHIAPDYYQQLDIELWFIIEDLRELVRGDFAKVRDVYLANFTTPAYNNRTFTIYGNPYEYPLHIELKKPEQYFIESKTYYIDALQSSDFVAMKKRLIHFNLGDRFEKHCLVSTLEDLTKAELEIEKYTLDKENGADCSHIIIFYARSFEQEMWEFAKILFSILSARNKDILEIPYKVQGINFTLKDIFENKPNLGTYAMLLSHYLIKERIDSLFDRNPLRFYLNISLPKHIKSLQKIRNTSVHQKKAHLQEALHLRAIMLGIGLALGESGVFGALIEAKNMLKDFKRESSAL
ncbi:ATP-binding protein [Helicobacter sp. MIT 21-1697]|uniref:HP0729 family protein n=1 Tax=Helicobacter sp. MIT 21-1697 TaxID=2993733 RepID=UPI00224B5D0A|nr:HP0729 family protein [Helicobacter sp. MIT 21-1697]MCX2716132.1 ATP-binding protein [Helicobacter sp. MIT 21-1697]